jgi:hypothetical protein
MQNLLHSYMAMRGTATERLTVAQPDDGVVLQCLTAIGDTPLEHVDAVLRELFRDQSPRHPNGPKGYAWFPKVLAGRFGQVPA